MLTTIIHYTLHLFAPLGIAYVYNAEKWQKAYLILLATMIVDLDHLLASPIFDPNRCSIGFHPLHSDVAILIYFFLIFPRRSRLVGIGLLFHMCTDGLDCLMQGCL